MPMYLVTLPRTTICRNLVDGADAQVVFAADATTAIQMASAKYDGDGQSWLAEATATALAAATDWIGWAFRIQVTGTPVDVTVNATGAASDTMDEIGALLATALNATQIDNASYNASTNTLTVASAADNLGNRKVQVTITPPNGKSGVPALVGTIVDGGVAAAALTVILPLDAAVIPSVCTPLKQV